MAAGALHCHAKLARTAPMALLALVLATPAAAEDDAEPGDSFSVEGSVTLVSEYRYRGYSLSGKDPAIQPEVYLTHASGAYGYFWGSTLGSAEDVDTELDFGVGYATAVGPFDADISATWYHYPGTSGFDYAEFYASLSAEVGKATLGAELGYAPPQSNLEGVANYYSGVWVSAPLGQSPLWVNGSLGFENGAFADNKFDWSLGLAAETHGVQIALTYVDSAHNGDDPMADPTLVVSIKKAV